MARPIFMRYPGELVDAINTFCSAAQVRFGSATRNSRRRKVDQMSAYKDEFRSRLNKASKCA